MFGGGRGAWPLCLDGGGRVGGFDGILYALNVRDGSEGWSYQLTVQILASCAVGQGKIIALTDKGTVACFGE